MVPCWDAVMPRGIFFLEVGTQFSHFETLPAAVSVTNEALEAGMSPVPTPGATATCSCPHSSPPSGKWWQWELKELWARIYLILFSVSSIDWNISSFKLRSSQQREGTSSPVLLQGVKPHPPGRVMLVKMAVQEELMSKGLLPAQLARSDPMKTSSDGCPGPGWLLGRGHRGVHDAHLPPLWCWTEIPHPPSAFPPPLRKAERKQGIFALPVKGEFFFPGPFQLCFPCCRVHLAPGATNVPKLPSPPAARLPRGYQVLPILD